MTTPTRVPARIRGRKRYGYSVIIIAFLVVVFYTAIAGTAHVHLSPGAMGGGSAIASDGWPSAMGYRTWGGMNYEHVGEVAIAIDGVYMAGSTNSFGVGGNDAFLVKYDASGNQLWNRTWGGVNSESGYGVAATVDGVYLAGGTFNFGAGGTDAFIVKYDASGNQLWNRTWGGVNSESGYGVAATADGAYLAGYTYSFGAGSTDAFIVSYDGLGNQLWNRTWGGTGYDDGNGIAIGADGIYLAGRTFSFGFGAGDVFLAKYDTSGSQLWNQTWGGTKYEYQSGLAATTDGIYLAGGTDSFGAGDTDAFLVKYDVLGGRLWSLTWGGGNMDNGRSMSIGAGGVLLAGDTYSFGASGTGNYVAKFNSLGIQIWNRTYEMQFNEIYIAGTTDGIYIAGSSWSSVTGQDAYIAKYDNSGNQQPSITHPPDVSFTAGHSGHFISWTIQDTTTGWSLYTLSRNGMTFGTDVWSNGSTVILQLDRYAAGSYNCTITASDGLGSSFQDTVIVTVIMDVTPWIIGAIMGLAAIIVIIPMVVCSKSKVIMRRIGIMREWVVARQQSRARIEEIVYRKPTDQAAPLA